MAIHTSSERCAQSGKPPCAQRLGLRHGWMRWRSIRLPEGQQAVSAPPKQALPGLGRDDAHECSRCVPLPLVAEPSMPAISAPVPPHAHTVAAAVDQQLTLSELKRSAA